MAGLEQSAQCVDGRTTSVRQRLPPPAPPMPALPCDVQSSSSEADDSALIESCVVDPPAGAPCLIPKEKLSRDRSRSRSFHLSTLSPPSDKCDSNLRNSHTGNGREKDDTFGKGTAAESLPSNEIIDELDDVVGSHHSVIAKRVWNELEEGESMRSGRDKHKKPNHKSKKTKIKKKQSKKKKKRKKTNSTKKSKKKRKSSSSSSSSSSALTVEDPSVVFARAVDRGSPDEIRRAKHILKKNGISWMDASGNSPLHLATHRNCIEIVTCILGLPAAPTLLDAQNLRGETALLMASRLFRGTIALRLVEALADPSILSCEGDSPETFDLDGLLRETESCEAIARNTQQQKVLEAIAATRKSREEAEWRQRLFFETGFDEDEPFADYADLEYRDVESGGRDWTDEIAAEVAARHRKDLTERSAEYAKSVEEAKRKAKAEAQAQEEQARAFARETDAAKGTKQSLKPSLSAEEESEERVRRRSSDETRWRMFEEKVQALSNDMEASTSTQSPNIRFKDIPWPSGPPENPLLIDPEGHPAMLRSQLRAGLLRWHPDKFAQRVGRFMPSDDAENEKALSRVKDIAQQLNRLITTLTVDKPT